jgi:hypothetical protein
MLNFALPALWAAPLVNMLETPHIFAQIYAYPVFSRTNKILMLNYRLHALWAAPLVNMLETPHIFAQITAVFR